MVLVIEYEKVTSKYLPSLHKNPGDAPMIYNVVVGVDFSVVRYDSDKKIRPLNSISTLKEMDTLV